MKRIFLFLAVNFLVVMTISLVLSFLNVRPYLTSHGLNYSDLLTFCLIWGMGGALISLGLSRIIAKWMMGVQVIDHAHAQGIERKLVEVVERLSKNAGLYITPEVGIFQSNQLNAFATGPSKNRSLVAVSTALLNEMNEGELEAVLGHEISHIANGDMVTMTLIQGIVNAFVMFFARALAYVVLSFGSRGKSNQRISRMSLYILTFVFEIAFMIIGSMAIALFSRIREFRADQGGAMLSSKDKMITALQKLDQKTNTRSRNQSMNAFMISRPSKRGILRLFATHPPIEERIARLQGVVIRSSFA